MYNKNRNGRTVSIAEEREIKRQIVTMMKMVHRGFSHLPEKTFFAYAKEVVETEVKYTDIQEAIKGLKSRGMQNLIQSLCCSTNTLTVPYLMGTDHLISYYFIKDGNVEKRYISDSLSTHIDIFERLGYIQISRNYLVRKCQICHKDAKYIYLDTMEYIPYTKSFTDLHSDFFEALEMEDPNWVMEPGKYHEARLRPRSRGK